MMMYRLSLVVVVAAVLPAVQLQAQQSYVNNEQLNCDKSPNATLGFLCNADASCTSYLTFRSTPTYNNPATIAYLLAADAAQIAAANNISDIDPLPADTLVIVPVECSCSGDYYQHNASYVLKRQGETYFTVANDTYQALTTCQAMIAQNSYDPRRLFPEMKLSVPLRCACPTSKQKASGYAFLLTYLIRSGNTYESISGAFAGAGADVRGILDANMLAEDKLIFFFTPILVPLRTQPTKQNIDTAASPLLPPPAPTIPSTPVSGGGSGSRKWVFIGVGIGVAALIMASSVFAMWLLKRVRDKPLPSPHPKVAEESGEWSEEIRSAIESLTVYKFEEIEKATNSFAERNRMSSRVYRGSFKGDDGVVKIMKGDVSGEIDALRRINHSHIVRLSGFCLRQGITYLVYEYAEKGPLREWLRPGPAPGLDWKQRVEIARDVADALNYLHNFTSPPYVHKNLTSSNVLLDGNMRAKIGNFGLARTLEGEGEGALTRHVVGTYGYMAPEYLDSGLVSPNMDVFALGVVMLELLSGKVATDGEEMLCERIEGVLGGDSESLREKLRGFMDPVLGQDYPLELAYSLADLARTCVAPTLTARPPVSRVFLILSDLLSSSLDWDTSPTN